MNQRGRPWTNCRSQILWQLYLAHTLLAPYPTITRGSRKDIFLAAVPCWVTCVYLLRFGDDLGGTHRCRPDGRTNDGLFDLWTTFLLLFQDNRLTSSVSRSLCIWTDEGPGFENSFLAVQQDTVRPWWVVDGNRLGFCWTVVPAWHHGEPKEFDLLPRKRDKVWVMKWRSS